MMLVSHARGSRHQKLKHHIRRHVRQINRVAVITATMTAAATHSGGARADSVRPKEAAPSARPQRATLPLESSSATAPSTPVAKQPVAKPTKKSGAKDARGPQVSTATTANFPSSIAKSTRSRMSASLHGTPSPLLATRPETSTESTSQKTLLAQADVARPATKIATPASPTATPAAAAKVPVAKVPVAKTPATPTPKAANDDRVLLAQLDAELMQTEKKLKSTNEKLSDGQRELMSLSNTLRTVMIEDGNSAAGLHPFVRVASRYAGTPYVWGGESRYGFDCSGFIIRVMRDLGYKALPHSAAEQFKYGKPVAQSLLQPGDIVFFANTYKPGISHVGIYIGKRKFIHAASTREGTIVSSLDASPYRQKYAGARRLVAVGKRA